jgi:regulator of RNase E activity RraA
MMAAQAERRGIAGMVIYGSIRDYDTLHEGTFPVFAAGVTHRGPYKDGPGEINVPIAIEGMVIAPGDLIVGDGDGIVCVPFEVTEEVLTATEAKHQAEIKQFAAIKAGTVDRAWVDAALTRLGCRVQG